MLDRLHLPGRTLAALAAAALLLGPLPASAAKKKPAPTVAERLAHTAADIDALITALEAAFPAAATKADQTDQQANLAEGYLGTARKSITDLGPTLDPKFNAIPLKAASNPLSDAVKIVDDMSGEAENAPTEPWALQVISIQQDLHMAKIFIEAVHLLPEAPAAGASPGPHAARGER
jgi:hypothetical protein